MVQRRDIRIEKKGARLRCMEISS